MPGSVSRLRHGVQYEPNTPRAVPTAIAQRRHLLHQPGSISYQVDAITVNIDRPNQPRIARALRLLTEELNTTPATIPGDNRPIT